jgi:hypothetical protein
MLMFLIGTGYYLAIIDSRLTIGTGAALILPCSLLSKLRKKDGTSEMELNKKIRKECYGISNFKI